ncbi:MAG TPA: hypothetical protein H9850_04485 [Candidatus Anaerobiospirillum pullistercoris]|uniref:Uncharacterized protein n=1 Tax=Candidatus Anaerobiospirillum pullistercoris TaxID=2838452 RepID=A0A9D1WCJ5_9GAMM|nr:hypothetical protein [Candidatus Anaerobiospirillum pullistercoris]
MAQPVSELPNQNFISYLSKYGLNSNLQFDEYVTKSARDLGIQAFNFDLPLLASYREEIMSAVANNHSTLILLTGRAGDGKTHFLRQLFTDPESIGHSTEDWERVPNCCFDINTQTASGTVTFTLIKDFTNNDKPADNERLRNTIEQIVRQNEEGPSKSDPNEHCQIVIIAGNHGKIMERFQNLFSDSSKQSQSVGTFISALETYMLEHDDRQLKALPWVQSHDMSVCLGAPEIKKIFDDVLGSKYWQNCEHCAHASYCPILRNRAVMRDELVLTRFLQLHELIVDNGQHFTVRNMMLLLANAILGTNTQEAMSCSLVAAQENHLKPQAIEGSSIHDNIVEPDSLLASNPFDNIFGLNASANKYEIMSQGSGKGFKRKSTLAFASQEKTIPIFADLRSIAVGQFSTKLIDDMILADHSNNADECADINPDLCAQYQEIINKHDHYGLNARLKQAYHRLSQGLLNNDDVDSEAVLEALHNIQEHLNSLHRLLFFTVKHPQLDNLQDLLDPKGQSAAAPSINFSRSSSLGRAVSPFIRRNANPLGRSSTLGGIVSAKAEPPLFAPYMLTGYTFALQYLKLKHTAMKHVIGGQDQSTLSRPVNIKAALDEASALMVGLNRAFTGLMLLHGAADFLYITTTNKLNPMAQSILLDRQRYCVKVDYEGIARDDAVRFELNANDLVDVVFHQAGNGNSRLHLTPKLFEYLMSLASGKVSMSFSSECHNELAAFKASIAAKISKRSDEFDRGVLDVEQMLHSVLVCKLNAYGDIA